MNVTTVRKVIRRKSDAKPLTQCEPVVSVKPLTSKSDQKGISPYNITPKLHIKITRKGERIIK